MGGQGAAQGGARRRFAAVQGSPFPGPAACVSGEWKPLRANFEADFVSSLFAHTRILESTLEYRAAEVKSLVPWKLPRFHCPGDDGRGTDGSTE